MSVLPHAVRDTVSEIAEAAPPEAVPLMLLILPPTRVTLADLVKL